MADSAATKRMRAKPDSCSISPHDEEFPFWHSVPSACTRDFRFGSQFLAVYHGLPILDPRACLLDRREVRRHGLLQAGWRPVLGPPRRRQPPPQGTKRLVSTRGSRLSSRHVNWTYNAPLVDWRVEYSAGIGNDMVGFPESTRRAGASAVYWLPILVLNA